jgi:hypothetical protein
MKTINLPATNFTPEVKYDEDGKLLIKGRSISHNEISFYQPLIEWAGTLKNNRLIVDINLEYINSGSSKKLLTLLKALNTNVNIKHLLVNWHYEEGDEDNLVKGQLFEESLPKAEFTFHKNDETN